MDHHFPMLLNNHTRPHKMSRKKGEKRKEAFVFNALPETPMLRSSPLLGLKNQLQIS